MTSTSVSYDDNDDFYAQYAKYLREEGVRAVHDKTLAAVKLHPAFSRVLDLGCGQGNEFFHYGRPKSEFYFGIDLNAIPVEENTRIVRIEDYRDPETVAGIVKEYGITGIVSLYSSELTEPTENNNAFYARLFADNPSLRVVYVPGIYYEAHIHEETVRETGGLISYQTKPVIENPSPSFIETRAVIPCPSAMFGNCIEAHRLLQRPGDFNEDPVKALAALVPEGRPFETHMSASHRSFAK